MAINLSKMVSIGIFDSNIAFKRRLRVTPREYVKQLSDRYNAE